MKKIISFFKTDIKIINSYFLFTIILIILVCVGYSSYALFSFTKTSTNVIEGTVGELKKNIDTSGANAPVLASNMIPVYYDETNSVWKKSDVSNMDKTNPWYSYNSTGEYKGMWANAVTVTATNRRKYLSAAPGTKIPMSDINTMWVWIPRFKAVTPSNYNGTTKAKPNAIDVTFVKQNETAIDAFTFGNKQLSGFWYGKFEIGGTLASSCSNETCNVSNIVVKPNVSSLRNQTVSSFFFASRSMEQTGNSFGFVNIEVDTHMSKNNEWGAVAYLTQSIYGRCTSNTTCTEVGINNNKSYITGYGAPPGSDYNASNGAYNTSLGKDASTTKNIYGIYDMSGGADEYVMGVLADPNGKPRSGNSSSWNSGFTGMLKDGTTYTGVSFPDTKYYNNYTGTTYTGHALTETKNWYSDDARFVNTGYPWFRRSGGRSNTTYAGVFEFYRDNGNSGSESSSRLVISNK